MQYHNIEELILEADRYWVWGFNKRDACEAAERGVSVGMSDVTSASVEPIYRVYIYTSQ